MKRPVEPFGDEVVRLRLIEERDLATTLLWRNRDDARIWFKTTDLLSIDRHRAWYRQYLQRSDDYLFVIETEGIAVGQAAVYGIDWDARDAEVGRFLVAPGVAGRGLMNRACALLLAFCARELGLHSVFLEVHPANERALRLYRRHGFVALRRSEGWVRMERALIIET